MASKAPRARAYQPRRDRTWRRRRDNRQPQPVPTLAALLTVIPGLSRPELARLVQRMIDRMDEMDGDPDFEDSNDREAHDGDDQGDISWPEWHTRDRRSQQEAGPELSTTCLIHDHEDAEDDDPGGGNVDDEPQMGAGDAYYRRPPRYGIDQTKGAINRVKVVRQHRRDMGCADA